jgi:hypothetical protein
MNWKIGVLWIHLTKTILCGNSFSLMRPAFRSFTSGENDRYKYGSKDRKLFKQQKHYKKLVEDHHCIPQQWKDHDLIERLNFDINCSDNLLIMPNKKGKNVLNLHPGSLIHEGGHLKYNNFVKYHLDEINKNSFETSRYEFWLFLNFLKKNMKYNEDNIPWK